MKKRILAFLCILSLVMTNVMPAYASYPVDSKVETAEKAEMDTEENKIISKSFTFVNPVYADQITEEELEKELSNIQKEEKKSSSKTKNTEYISDLNVLAEIVREKMERRESSISVNYKGSSYEGVPKEIVYMAMEETGVPTEGDYLFFHYGGYKCGISGTIENDTYYLTFNYTMSYYTTWEQEETVTDTVEKVLSELGIKNNGQIVTSMSDYEKVCKIYDYICSNITYDYENLYDETYTLKAAAYAALIHKTAVCQGYANLFYRMAKEAGVDARIISGTSGVEGHAWNIVKLDGKYYNLDSTWDAGRSEYDFFLKGTKDFDEASSLNKHNPDAEYLTEEFTSAYPISDKYYVTNERKELENDFSISADSYLYTGSEIKPAVNSETYVLDKDYIVTYEDNINAGEGTASVIIKGIGNYEGTYEISFTINAVMLNDSETSVQTEYSSVAYDGMEKKPAVTVTHGSKILKQNEDYILTYSGNTEPGWAVIDIEGIGNYKGTMTRMFEITPPAEVPDEGEEPGASEFVPEEVEGIEYLRVSINGAFGDFTIRKEGLGWSDEWQTNGVEDDVIAGKTLSDMGYTKVTNPVHADNPDKRFEGWMVGVKVLETESDGKKIYKWRQVKSEGLLTSAEIINYKIPKYHGLMFYAKWEGEEFPVWTEEVGLIKVSVQGDGGLYDVTSGDFTWTTGGFGNDMLPGTTVRKNGYEVLSDPVYDENPDRGFLGWKACTIDRIIRDGHVDQVVNEIEGVGLLSTEEIHDYVIPECEEFVFLAKWECEEHVFAGWQMTPATMEESGEKTNKCEECGYTEYEEIPQIDTVTLSVTSYTYTGKAITTPKVTVKDIDGNKLTLNEDYKVTYSNNVNAGKAAVKVTFMGDYAGNPVTKTFIIKPVAVAKLKISMAAAYTYNGSARKPAVTVKNASNMKLVSGKDYTVSYAAGRKNVGKYAVQITCKGNYSGTKTLYFTINPKGTTIKSLTKGAKRFTVKWNKVTTQTTGYQIRYSRNSSMAGAKTVTVKNNKTISATVKNLVAKKKYFVQVRTYKTVNGTKYYSGWSAKKSVTVK